MKQITELLFNQNEIKINSQKFHIIMNSTTTKKENIECFPLKNTIRVGLTDPKLNGHSFYRAKIKAET